MSDLSLVRERRNVSALTQGDVAALLERVHRKELCGGYITSTAPGALPQGTRVESLEADRTPPASQATVIGSVGPNRKGVYGYFVVWDDLTECVVYVWGHKVKPMSQEEKPPQRPLQLLSGGLPSKPADDDPSPIDESKPKRERRRRRRRRVVVPPAAAEISCPLCVANQAPSKTRIMSAFFAGLLGSKVLKLLCPIHVALLNAKLLKNIETGVWVPSTKRRGR